MKTITRFQKAHLIARMGLCKVIAHDKKGLVRHVLVPGTEGKQYHVYLSRDNARKVIYAQCELETGRGGLACQGNKKTVCTHAMTATIVAAQEAGREARVCGDLLSAKRLLNLHPDAVATPLISRQSARQVILVSFE